MPGLWLHRAFAQLCFAGVALALGIAALIFMRAFRATVTVVMLAVVALALVALPQARRSLVRSRCSDTGGRWDTATLAWGK